MKTLLFSLIVALAGIVGNTPCAQAGEPDNCCPACDPYGSYSGDPNSPWHCGYYHVEWGSPVALVVPPTAENYREMGWGVGNTRLRPIGYQYGRAYPGPMPGPPRRFLATPAWPSDTTQFGVYYVRGPW